MRKVIYYVASSIDGKIADSKGGVDWLEKIPLPKDSDYGYSDFYKSIDSTLMGAKTYQQILGFPGDFPYSNKKNYVFTRNPEFQKSKFAEIVNDNPVDFVKGLKQKDGQDIWLVGGGEVAGFLLKSNLVDEIHLFIMPVVLGSGISLFGDSDCLIEMTLEESEKYSNGVIRHVYSLSQKKQPAN